MILVHTTTATKLAPAYTAVDDILATVQRDLQGSYWLHLHHFAASVDILNHGPAARTSLPSLGLGEAQHLLFCFILLALAVVFRCFALDASSAAASRADSKVSNSDALENKGRAGRDRAVDSARGSDFCDLLAKLLEELVVVLHLPHREFDLEDR